MNDFTGMRPNTMSSVEIKRSGNGAGALRIEPVDNWHGAWAAVLRAVEEQGKIKKLAVDADGWLSARQVLMVAFVNDAPAAHICFSVLPGKGGCVEATLDSFGIDGKFCGRGIESQLHRSAVERAEALGCAKLRGFKLDSTWC
jgi:GNAT superfamily N-acetyltransferase